VPSLVWNANRDGTSLIGALEMRILVVQFGVSNPHGLPAVSGERWVECGQSPVRWE
jgi:hypothetical protein